MPGMRGPKPTHRPDFPSEFLAEAQTMRRRRNISFPLRQRAALVCLLQREPEISHPEAAAETHLAVDSVRRLRRRWALGDFSFADRAGRGAQARFFPLWTTPR